MTMIPVCGMRDKCTLPSKGYISNFSLMIQNARRKLNTASKVMWKNNSEHGTLYIAKLN